MVGLLVFFIMQPLSWGGGGGGAHTHTHTHTAKPALAHFATDLEVCVETLKEQQQGMNRSSSFCDRFRTVHPFRPNGWGVSYNGKGRSVFVSFRKNGIIVIIIVSYCTHSGITNYLRVTVHAETTTVTEPLRYKAPAPYLHVFACTSHSQSSEAAKIRELNNKLTFVYLKCIQNRLILDRKSNSPSCLPYGSLVPIPTSGRHFIRHGEVALRWVWDYNYMCSFLGGVRRSAASNQIADT